MKVLTANEVYQKLAQLNSKRTYRAMYSSLLEGVVSDPALMTIPIDDHMVHRGDGVFEAIRVCKTQIYLLEAHIERLISSAEMLKLKLKWSKAQLIDLCQQLCSAVRKDRVYDNGILRVFVARGPGDFSPNPYSTLGTQLYMVATDFNPVAKEKYETGVSLGISEVPVKPSFYSRVKSCNYLPNVMMKKESIDRNLDYVINLNDDGFVAEGPTENLLIVTAAGDLCAPKFDYTLAGTTLKRAMWFAQHEMNMRVQLTDLQKKDLIQAQEIMMVGTTLGILPVTRFENIQIGSGQVGAVARALNLKIQNDMQN